jgi:hypothetical protein
MEQNTTNVTLTPAEKSLASRIQFDEQVLRLVKSMVGRNVEPYAQFNKDLGVIVEADWETDGKGFTVWLADSEYDNWHLDVIFGLRELLPPQYQAFLTSNSVNHHFDVTILKTADPYEIIRVRSTRGWDFVDKFYTSEDLIGVISEWQRECRLNIIGADSEKIMLIMETLPDDLADFAEKVNFLCWELDQINKLGHYGDGPAEDRIVAEKLAAHLQKTRRLYLWWD